MTWKAISIAAVIAPLAGPASALDEAPVAAAPAFSAVPAPAIAGPILKMPQEAGDTDPNINRRIENTLQDAGAIPADPPDRAYGAFQRGFFLIPACSRARFTMYDQACLIAQPFTSESATPRLLQSGSNSSTRRSMSASVERPCCDSSTRTC